MSRYHCKECKARLRGILDSCDCGCGTVVMEHEDSATKHDTGKRDWSILPWAQLEEVVKVLE